MKWIEYTWHDVIRGEERRHLDYHAYVGPFFMRIYGSDRSWSAQLSAGRNTQLRSIDGCVSKELAQDGITDLLRDICITTLNGIEVSRNSSLAEASYIKEYLNQYGEQLEEQNDE